MAVYHLQHKIKRGYGTVEILHKDRCLVNHRR